MHHFSNKHISKKDKTLRNVNCSGNLSLQYVEVTKKKIDEANSETELSRCQNKTWVAL